jgi:hypothetical protein
MPGELKSKDMRSPDAQKTAVRLRRFNMVRKALISDLGGDPSKAQELLARNAAALALIVEEKVERKLAGLPVDVNELGTIMNNLRRQLETLGIERRARDVTADLSKYIENRRPPQLINGVAS